jgi:hypothetical protein
MAEKLLDADIAGEGEFLKIKVVQGNVVVSRLHEVGKIMGHGCNCLL